MRMDARLLAVNPGLYHRPPTSIIPGLPLRSKASASAPPRRRPTLLAAWLAALLLATCVMRAWRTQFALGDSAGCTDCLFWPVLGHDAWLLAVAWATLALSLASAQRGVQLAAALVALAIQWLMAVDLAILTTLNMRLYLFDVFKFGMEAQALQGFLGALLRSSGGVWLVLAVLALLSSFAVLLPGAADRRAAAGLAVAALFATIAAFVSRAHDPAYINADSLLNVVELHLAQGGNAPYSPDFVRALATRPAEVPTTCSPAQARRPDIIVLAVESLSSYQSAHFGGPLDLTPRIDAIAAANTWFTRFHANGFSTDAGLIAMLTGRAPVPAIGRYRSLDAFAGFDDPAHSVVAPLEAAGYRTHFFTSGDLGFLDKAPWLESLGFDHWEGAEHPFYAGWPRGGFSAAEDRALYLRLLDWMQGPEARRPWFAFVLTVQSHPPFVDKDSGKLDEAAVFGAIDAEVGRFHDELAARGFFEHGLLLITGDHRSMTPLHPEERARHGDAAFARVPMIVVGNAGLPHGAIDAPFSHTDLLPSLADLVGSTSCRRADQGLFLRGDVVAPSWILHARGDARNRIDVYAGGRASALILDGDDSRWIGNRPPQWQAIEDEIHRDRIRRGELDSDIEALIEILGR
jgi:lipoteichoic acid synthase